MSPRSFFLVSGLLALANAFTSPTQQTWGPLLLPDTTHPVTQGETFTVTWDPSGHPTDGVTVSLVLCNGPGANCILQSTAIAEKLPAAQRTFNWNVPCSLPVGTQSTASGYGMLVIVDGTGEFQFSTQFSVLAGSKCGNSGGGGSSSTTSSSGPSSTTAPPPSSTTHGGGYGGSTTQSVTTTTVVSTTSSVIDTVTIHNSYTHPNPSQSSQPVTSSLPGTDSATLVTVTSSNPTAFPSSASSAPSTVFTGAAARATNGALGLIAGGALAMLAL